MTGGPIGDNRIQSDKEGMVTFTARSNSKQKGKTNPPRPIELSGAEFVRRWSLHVLPKGFTRSRCYGGFHGSRRKAYLAACRKLLPVTEVEAPGKSDPREELTKPAPKCPRCQIEMNCIAERARPSWRELLECASDGPNSPKVAFAETNTDSTLDQKSSRDLHREKLHREVLPLPEV